MHNYKYVKNRNEFYFSNLLMSFLENHFTSACDDFSRRHTIYFCGEQNASRQELSVCFLAKSNQDCTSNA
jgi:hypothetical protein